MEKEAMEDARRFGRKQHVMRQQQAGAQEQSRRPQQRAEKDTRAEG
ncbi:MAG: hypothetical protein Q7R30_04245 [Acidobacteriota bacterium]|nr:hypothetical protein [Acidobacteriota bacterium]